MRLVSYIRLFTENSRLLVIFYSDLSYFTDDLVMLSKFFNAFEKTYFKFIGFSSIGHDAIWLSGVFDKDLENKEVDMNKTSVVLNYLFVLLNCSR